MDARKEEILRRSGVNVRKCMKCGKCYSKAIQGQEIEINELLK